MSDLPNGYGPPPQHDPQMQQRLPATPAERERILACVHKYVESGKRVAKNYQDIARVNERFCLGDQWGSHIWKNGQVHVTPDDWADSQGLDRRHVNIIQNVKLTWASLITRERPGVKAVPANVDDANGHFVAETANRLIAFFQTELDTARHVHQAVLYACEHGGAGIKVMVDPKTGSITWTPQTIFNVIVDPRAQDFRKGQFVCFMHNLTLEDAQAELERAGINPDDVGEESYKNAANEELQGVPTLEAWIKPCKDYPRGLYAFVIGGQHVVETTDFPYVFGTDDQPEYVFPLAWMKVREIRDCAYGATNLTDAIPLQRSLNEVNNRLMKLLRASTMPHLLMPALLGLGDANSPSGVEIDPDNTGVIRFTMSQAEMIREMRWTETPQANPQLYSEREYYRNAINDVIGINEVTSGQKSKAISGRAIENITELDSQKNADFAKSMQDCVDDAWALTLRLVQRDYSPERKAKLTAQTGLDLELFSAADVTGSSIRLEPASELDTLASMQAADADERAAAGLPPSADAAAAGLQGALSDDAAEALIAAYLAGEPIDLNPDDVNLEVVASVIQRHVAQSRAAGREDDAAALEQLATGVRAMMVPAEQLAPQQGASEDPTPPGAPV